jgi:hypothetical protein
MYNDFNLIDLIKCEEPVLSNLASRVFLISFSITMMHKLV